MKADQKKELAKLLFTREGLAQKEIAERVGVSEQTISKWVNANEGEWRRMRQSLIITKEEQLHRIYEQLEEITLAIKKKEIGSRYAGSKDADVIVKLTAAAKNLESEASIADIVEVSKRFLNWLRPVDLEKAKEFAVFMDAFMKDQLKK